MSERPVALVTGGGTGIGAACCRALAAEGFRVVVHFRSSEEKAAKVAAELDGAFTVRGDIGDAEQVEAIVKAIKDEAGRVDVLVNNAGLNVNAPVLTMKLDDYSKENQFEATVLATERITPDDADVEIRELIIEVDRPDFDYAAGQSIGVWNVSGLNLTLIGDANDYVGKGMAGGQIVIRPPDDVDYLGGEFVVSGTDRVLSFVDVARKAALGVDYPEQGRPPERVRSTLVLEGQAGGTTAMARAVGLPVLIAVKLLLGGELSLTGSLIPTHPSVYEPILRRIERAGLRFTETRTPIGS